MGHQLERSKMQSLQPATRAGNAQRPTRSQQMVGCLRESMLYSEKRARDLLFDAIEQILSRRGASPTLSRLARESATVARLSAQRSGYEFSNWEPASKAVVNAMLHAGVLLSANATPILPGLAAQATPVAALDEKHRDRTEAFLLEFLIAKLHDISIRDHKALAHALFRQFDPSISMEDLEDRVVLLLATLAGRVSIGEDGTYAIAV
jgi:hypothetical protein